ncbi:hypothetical protein PG913_01605 [Tenacibaculum pacificus]|uniref:hypothetical protein n=1 Tax=Tenacibaculum pacificus TaxID=3018314 RepID=UPI0022F3AAC8|nr:hypothetical protein [Tenacibaculum pacificus]WBX73965.1 hypothetical protein PG913_01605 [Tenacibaculum pacificus]
MKHYLFLLLSLVFFIFSCKKEENKTNTPIQKTGMDTAVKHPKYTELDKTSTKEIEKWKEYFILENFLQQLKKITPAEALNNALELKQLTKHLKDSLNITTLKTPAFKARMNVFQNEILRLNDMENIPAITPKEVNSQLSKVFVLFGSMNTKINTIYAKKQFDKEINLDSLFNFK